MTRTLLVATLLCALWPLRGAAQDQPIRSNNYGIDLFTGPVIGPGRIVGMAGAYTAIATGIDGAQWNPASYAERAEHEIDWWEWEITGGLSLGGLFRRNDFDNNGTSALSTADALRLTVGGRLQFAQLGLGVHVIGQEYTLSDERGSSADVSFVTTRIGTAYAFFDGTLVAGVAMRSMTFDVGDPRSEETVVNFDGLGAEMGVLLRPALKRYRLGAAFRSAVESRPSSSRKQTDADGVMRAQGLVLPDHVHVPWEANVGFAYLLGERRANVPWRHTRTISRRLKHEIENGLYEAPERFGGPPYPVLPANKRVALETALLNDREAERRFMRAQPRRYVLLSADFVIYGPTERGQSVEAFLVQREESSGRKISYGMRIGAESEPVRDRLKVRAGSYLEPSRTNRSYYRAHGTLGADVRMFDLWGWSFRGGATIDLAPRYFDWGIGVGLWY